LASRTKGKGASGKLIDLIPLLMIIIVFLVTFERLVNIKTRSFKCEGYGHYDYQCSLKSRHVRIMPHDNVDDLKVVKDVTFFLRLLVLSRIH